MSRLFKTLSLAALLAGAIYFYAPARLAAIVLIGRSPVCPMANAVRSAGHVRDLRDTKDRILAASKKVREDPAGYELWQTPRGDYWIPKGSQWALPFNLAEQELDIYGLGEQAVRAGDVVLDCGANVGVYTRKALAAGAKLVVAIEPAPENLEVLKRNFTAEMAAGRVILYPKGVWDKDDFLTLQIDPQNSAADSFLIHREGGREGAKVPLTTIDKLVAELKLDRVDYIKMDIEGAEQRALTGARATLAKDHPRMALSAYHNPSDPEKIPELVRQGWSGYRMECGPCAEANGRVRPDVLYFR
ncbi:MAG: FkbM family methyltransferase [Acidobacteria bacterium]|nr:FkbM family methyltransferase [Acidobacteriota bacterium]